MTILLLTRLAVFAVLAVLAALTVRRHPRAGFALLGTLVVWHSDEQVIAVTSIGSFALFPEDLVFVVLGTAGALSLDRLHRNVSRRAALSLLAASLAVAALRGLEVNGEAAAAEERPFVYLVAGLLFVLTTPADRLAHEVRLWLRWTAVALSVLAAWHTATRGLGHSDDLYVDGAVFRTTRVLTANQALVVAFACLAATYEWLRARATRHGVEAGAWLVLVLVAQHRSVVLAVGVGILGLLIAGRRHRVRLRVTPMLVPVWLVVLLVPIAAATHVFDGAVHSFTAAWSGTWQENSTLQWRLLGWGELLAEWKRGGLSVTALGFPFGHGYTRVVQGHLVNATPHNFFIHLLLRGGLVAVLAFSVLLLRSVLRSRMHADYPLLLALAATIAVFACAYSLSSGSIVALGFVLATGTRQAAAGDEALDGDGRPDQVHALRRLARHT